MKQYFMSEKMVEFLGTSLSAVERRALLEIFRLAAGNAVHETLYSIAESAECYVSKVSSLSTKLYDRDLAMRPSQGFLLLHPEHFYSGRRKAPQEVIDAYKEKEAATAEYRERRRAQGRRLGAQSREMMASDIPASERRKKRIMELRARKDALHSPPVLREVQDERRDECGGGGSEGDQEAPASSVG